MNRYKKRVTGRQLKKRLDTLFEVAMVCVLIGLMIGTTEPGYIIIFIGYAAVKLLIAITGKW